MRHPLSFVLAAAALTLWIDGLLWVSGDAGPAGWILDFAAPQLFLLPGLAAALVALRKRAWGAVGLGAATVLAQAVGPIGLCLGRPSDEKAELRVATFNVEKFDASFERVAAVVRGLDADVVCLQEASLWTDFKMPDRFRDLLPEYRFYATGGLAILSRLPFQKARTTPFDTPLGPAGWNLQEIVVEVGGRSVRVLNTHLIPQSYRLPGMSWTEGIETARRYREAEFDTILAQVGDDPLVLCGDFNQQPYGPRYRRLAQTLTDVYRATNRGFGCTSRSDIPVKRVDYVWTRGLRPLRARVAPVRASDHLPVVAELSFR